MKHRFRADGIAAASLALVATTAFAGPSAATRASTEPVSAPAERVSSFIPDTRSMDEVLRRRTGRGSVGAGTRHASAVMTRDVQDRPGPSLEARRSLRRLVRAQTASTVVDAERECLAGAVYFEARGEPIEGQLAVAEVVLNRASSGEYPRSICEVVTQPAQFSFVRDGSFPAIDRGSDGWRRAVAIANIAAENLASSLSSDVLWYHTDYVAPGWGRRLDRVTQIGAHIFYRRG